MDRAPSELVLNFTPTGMVPTKATTPHVPVTTDEIVTDVLAANRLGITVVHLHARDAGERPTYHADTYARLIEGIRAEAPELVICVSLSGRSFPALEQRAEPLQLTDALKPDMGSLTLTSMNFARQASVNAPDTVQALAIRMQERKILPELEVFDLGMLSYARYLAERDFIRPPFYANLFVGNLAGAQLRHAPSLIAELPARTIWALAGIGDAQLPANMLGIALDGGVRTGLEDNIFYDQARTRRATNIDLLRRIHRLASETDRSIMAPSTFRKLLSLAPGNGVYGRLE